MIGSARLPEPEKVEQPDTAAPSKATLKAVRNSRRDRFRVESWQRVKIRFMRAILFQPPTAFNEKSLALMTVAV